MFLRPFGPYCIACFGILFVSILCTCCSHFFYYCFISFIMSCALVFYLIRWFFSLSNFVIPIKCPKKFILMATYIAHLTQQCHTSKFVIFQERILNVSKCYNFLWVQRRQNCSPAASFANCVVTLYLLKVHLQTFLSIPVTQKCQILSWDTLVPNERNNNSSPLSFTLSNFRFFI